MKLLVNLYCADPAGELPGSDRGADEGKDDRRGKERAGSWRNEWRQTRENSATQSENMKSCADSYWALQDTKHTTPHKLDRTTNSAVCSMNNMHSMQIFYIRAILIFNKTCIWDERMYLTIQSAHHDHVINESYATIFILSHDLNRLAKITGNFFFFMFNIFIFIAHTETLSSY